MFRKSLWDFGSAFSNSCKYYKKSDIFRISWVLEVVMVQLVFQTANHVLETVSYTVINWKGVEIPPQLWVTARTILDCRCLCFSCQTQLNKHLYKNLPEDRSRSSTKTLQSIMNTKNYFRLQMSLLFLSDPTQQASLQKFTWGQK